MRSNTAEERRRRPPRPPALERQKSSSNPRAWCCTFAAAPASPDIRISHHSRAKRSPPPPHPPLEDGASAAAAKTPPASGSAYSSPSPASKLGRGIVTPRRILSPGRVSPIDTDPPAAPLAMVPSSAPASNSPKSGPVASDPEPERRRAAPRRPEAVERSLDLRLILRGKDGRCVALELDSSVLCAGSSVFAGMVLESRRKAAAAAARTTIEVAGVEDLGAFRLAIELMYEKDPLRLLVKAGVFRAIQILEVYSSIICESGILFCLKYIESVPWSETEEEKLKDLFAKGSFAKGGFEEVAFRDVLARLSLTTPAAPNDLAVQLVQSIINSSNNNARKELQALVNGLLSKSSVYEKDPTVLNMESLYNICRSSLNSLVELFAEASNCPPVTATAGRSPAADDEEKPLVGRVSKQVANISWLLEIMIEKQMAADFVAMWANQPQLVEMHELSSPMVRHELSRISAGVFVALGNGRVWCPGDVRSGVIRAWFPAILEDFGWLRRFPKGIDWRALEDGLGRAILTLPLGQQQVLLLEWLRCFTTRGTDCPNLSGAFQVWWRRSFVKFPPDLRRQYPASPTSRVPSSLVHFS